jgi:hypothetical protein
MALLDDLVRKHYEKKRPWREVIACIRAVNLEDDVDGSKRRALAHRWARGELNRAGVSRPDSYTGPEAVDDAFDNPVISIEPEAALGRLEALAREAGWPGD